MPVVLASLGQDALLEKFVTGAWLLLPLRWVKVLHPTAFARAKNVRVSEQNLNLTSSLRQLTTTISRESPFCHRFCALTASRLCAAYTVLTRHPGPLKGQKSGIVWLLAGVCRYARDRHTATSPIVQLFRCHFHCGRPRDRH